MVPRSLDSRLMIIPEGVESKKLQGLRTRVVIIISWALLLELTMQMLTRKYYRARATVYPSITKVRKSQ